MKKLSPAAVILLAVAIASAKDKAPGHDDLCVSGHGQIYHRCDCVHLRGIPVQTITLAEAGQRRMRPDDDCVPPPIPAALMATPTPLPQALTCAAKLMKSAWYVATDKLMGNPERSQSGTHAGSPGDTMVAFRAASISSEGFTRFRRGEPVVFESPGAREESGIYLTVTSAFKHNITRGRAAMEHESPEPISTTLVFLGEPKTDDLKCSDLTAAWTQLFTDANNGAVAILTANPSGVLVDEVKIGMTPADVEGVFGPPERKADLGSKLVYFYQKMKVTFVGGKVADVE